MARHLVWFLILSGALELLVSLFGVPGGLIIFVAGALVGTIAYIRVADWLEFRRNRPDAARPPLPDRRQGGLAMGGKGATINQNMRKSENRR